MKKFIVVADAGLNGWENKVYNNLKNNHAYIVTQPIKKLKKSLQERASLLIKENQQLDQTAFDNQKCS